MTIYDSNKYEKESNILKTRLKEFENNPQDDSIRIQLASSYYMITDYNKSLSTISNIKYHTFCILLSFDQYWI